MKEIGRLHCGEDHSVWKQRWGVSPSEKTEPEVGPSNQSLWMTPHPKQQQIHLLQVQHQGQSHGGSTVSPLIWSEPPGLLQEDPLETHLDHEASSTISGQKCSPVLSPGGGLPGPALRQKERLGIRISLGFGGNRNSCPSSRLLGGMWEMGVLYDFLLLGTICISKAGPHSNKENV